MILWWPAHPILAALLASLALPALVILLSHGPWRVRRPMRRYLAAAGLDTALMVAILLGGDPGRWPDWVAAVALLGGSLLAGFTLWTLVAWGFSLTMLRVLGEAGTVPSIEAWCRAYTGGHGIERFARDRSRLLVRLGLARLDGADALAITRRGRTLAAMVRAGRRVFGLG